MIDCALINTPLSSPLHAQANLPFLAGYLKQRGFTVRSFDTNIRFFRWFLAPRAFDCRELPFRQDPVRLLAFYNTMEEALAEACRPYRGLHVDLRSVRLAYDRVQFADVRRALDDAEANPFIRFYDEWIETELRPLDPRVIGISITFQDHIIAAFTLASRLRRKLPAARLVLGGQIVTRCYDTLASAESLLPYWDDLIAWDGEQPMADLLDRLLHHTTSDLVNVLERGGDPATMERGRQAFAPDNVDVPDFEDIRFEDYFFPEFLVPLQTSRGCYGTCEFCAIPAGSNLGFRQRSVPRIIHDIEEVQKLTASRYGRPATYFKFMDDTSSPATLGRLADAIALRGLDAKWETFTRMEAPFDDPAFMARLHRGGCRKLMWGLETNDPDILASMAKRRRAVSSTAVLDAAHRAGIMNFVFVLVGFPGETEAQRDALADYIIANPAIHVLTLATFDLTKRSRMQERFDATNPWGLECGPASDFEVRLPYTVRGQNWKRTIVAAAQRMLVKINGARPDIGFASLLPDQVRGILTDLHGNTWGKQFLGAFGEGRIRDLLLATERYAEAFDHLEEIDLSGLPETLKREHPRVREDIEAIERAIHRRRRYEDTRTDSI